MHKFSLKSGNLKNIMAGSLAILDYRGNYGDDNGNRTRRVAYFSEEAVFEVVSAASEVVSGGFRGGYGFRGGVRPNWL